MNTDSAATAKRKKPTKAASSADAAAASASASSLHRSDTDAIISAELIAATQAVQHAAHDERNVLNATATIDRRRDRFIVSNAAAAGGGAEQNVQRVLQQAPFSRARPISDLLDAFREKHDSANATAAATAAAAASSSSSSLAQVSSQPLALAQVPHRHGRMRMATTHDAEWKSNQFQQLYTVYLAERVVDMTALVQQHYSSSSPPSLSAESMRRYPLDSTHVFNVLCEPFGGFNSCTAEMCVGRQLGVFALMQYISPVQYEHFLRTGERPRAEEQCSLCYLCFMQLTCTAADLCVSGSMGGTHLSMPFYHLVNCPGGYVPEAMHRSSANGSLSGGVTHPFRRLVLSDYVADQRDVWRPVEFGADGRALSWAPLSVRGYSELAQLMFHTRGASTVPTSTSVAPAEVAVAHARLPSCEQLLADKMLSAHVMGLNTNNGTKNARPFARTAVSVLELENVARDTLQLRTSVIDALGGQCMAPVEIGVFDAFTTPLQLQLWDLCFCDLMLARARIIHLVHAHHNNFTTVMRTYRLTLAEMDQLKMAHANEYEFRYPFMRHIVFRLVCARLNELGRLLDTERPPMEISDTSGSIVVAPQPPPASGVGAAAAANDLDRVQRALQLPGVRQQLIEYRASLAPLFQFYQTRILDGMAINDDVLLQRSDTSSLLRYLELRPMPAPSYFTPADLATPAYQIKPSVARTVAPHVTVHNYVAAAQSPSNNNNVDVSSARDGGMRKAMRTEPVVAAAAASNQQGSFELYSVVADNVFCSFAQTIDALQQQQAAAPPLDTRYWLPRLVFQPLVTNHAAASPTLAELYNTSVVFRSAAECERYNQQLHKALLAVATITTVSIWRALVYRVNSACAVLERVLSQLRELDMHVQEQALDPSAWLPENWQVELAQQVYTTYRTVASERGVLDVQRDLEPLLRNMPHIGAPLMHWQQRIDELSSVAQALKRFIASHLPLASALLLHQRIYDSQAIAFLGEHTPQPYAPNALCDENMHNTAAELDTIEFLFEHSNNNNNANVTPATAVNTADSLYTWVMAHAMPAAVQVSEFVARHRRALAECSQYRRFAYEALQATLCGLYPHARHVASFEARLRYQWLFEADNATARDAAVRYYSDMMMLADEQQQQPPQLVSAESDERLFFLAIREHFVRTCALTPAYRMLVMSMYRDFALFEQNVVYHCESLRRTDAAAHACQLDVCNDFVLSSYFKSAQEWATFRRPNAPFALFMARCCRAVDLDLLVCEFVARRGRCSVPELCPPESVVRALVAYVQRLPPYREWDAAWLPALAVSDTGRALVERMYVEHCVGSLNDAAGETGLRQLCECNAHDYALLSVFFWAFAAHWRTRFYPLDVDTTARQVAALHANGMSSVSSAHVALVSSLQCCNQLRTFTVQAYGQFKGANPVRLNLNTHTLMCVTKRNKAYASNRSSEKENAQQLMLTAITAYWEVRDEVDTLAHAEARAFRQRELDVLETAMHDRITSYVRPLNKTKYTVSCDTAEVLSYPLVGWVYEQRGEGSGSSSNGGGGGNSTLTSTAAAAASASAAAHVVSCTLCPRCGSKTAFTPAMHNSNGFTCGACENDDRLKLRSLAQERCARCDQPMEWAIRAGKRVQLVKRSQHTLYHVVDDHSVPGMSFVREAFFCGTCNSRWVGEGVQRLTLHEVRQLQPYERLFGERADLLFASPETEKLRHELAQARANPLAPIPRVPFTFGTLPRLSISGRRRSRKDR